MAGLSPNGYEFEAEKRRNRPNAEKEKITSKNGVPARKSISFRIDLPEIQRQVGSIMRPQKYSRVEGKRLVACTV